MFRYLKGTVKEIGSTFIVVEVNNIGYLVYTANPYSFEEDKDYKVYIYQQIKEDEHLLFGFKTIEEQEMFLKLISVKGLGPKMTLPILATGSISGIADAINRENLLYLKKFPKIGDKLAKQMVLDLKGKVNIGDSNIDTTKTHEELALVLSGLGYKEKDYKSVLPKVSVDISIEEQVKEALKLLLK